MKHFPQAELVRMESLKVKAVEVLPASFWRPLCLMKPFPQAELVRMESLKVKLSRSSFEFLEAALPHEALPPGGACTNGVALPSSFSRPLCLHVLERQP